MCESNKLYLRQCALHLWVCYGYLFKYDHISGEKLIAPRDYITLMAVMILTVT